MRVATFNILHGVPLRDVPTDGAASADRGGRRRRRTRAGEGSPGAIGPRDGAAMSAPTGPEAGEPLIDPAFDGEQLGDPLDTLPDDIDPADVKVGGADPTRRVQWSPAVADPGELLRAIEELQQRGPVDVIALQEVDLRQPRTALADQAALVAEAIGAGYWRFVPSIIGIPGIAAEGADWTPATTADDDPPLPDTPIGKGPGGHRSAGAGATAATSAGSQARGAATRAAGQSAARSAAAQTTAPSDAPHYGVALISRYPVREWRVRRFPPAPMTLPLLAPTTGGRPRAVRVPDEPRAAVAAVIEAPNADLTVATAHLSFVPGYNTRQLLELRAFLAGMPRPMILMGDFNTPGGLPGLVTGWDQIARVPTYPVLRPRVQFDHIMADGWTTEALSQARESAQALQLPISDHCALLAEFPDL